jgi:hypothetical protein
VNASFFTSAQRPSLFGIASLAVTLLSSVWFAMCFTARERAWWNAPLWFLVFYAAAILLALRGVRSVLGVLALILALPPFVLLSIMIFAR